MTRRTLLSAITLLPTMMLVGHLLAACGGSEPVPFILQINSVDVVQPAVDRVELLFRPGALDQRFTPVSDGSFFGGTAATRVTATGEYLITLDRTFVDRNARPGPSTFLLDVPLRSTSSASTGAAPSVQVTFVRRDERIATAERFVTWPLPAGGQEAIQIRCLVPDFRRPCTNNDPLPTPDAGPPPADGG